MNIVDRYINFLTRTWWPLLRRHKLAVVLVFVVGLIVGTIALNGLVNSAAESIVNPPAPQPYVSQCVMVGVERVCY